MQEDALSTTASDAVSTASHATAAAEDPVGLQHQAALQRVDREEAARLSPPGELSASPFEPVSLPSPFVASAQASGDETQATMLRTETPVPVFGAPATEGRDSRV